MFCTLCNTSVPDHTSTCPRCGAVCETSMSSGTTDGPLDPCLPAGTRLKGGQYQVGRVLGHGGFGVTYEGTDTTLQLPVAIKEFFPSGCLRAGLSLQPGSKSSPEAFAEQRERFLEEARALSQLHHPGVVRVDAAFEENDTVYMVMELLEGQTLAAVLKTRGRLDEDEVLAYVEKLAEALETLHGRGSEGIPHRDIQPAHIMLTPDGRVVLFDFGAARQFAANMSRAMLQVLAPGYATKEQYSGRANLGLTIDIYALGATMYRALTGRVPPEAQDRFQGMELVAPHLLCPEVSLATSNAVVAALEMAVPRRPRSIAEFMTALKNVAPPSMASAPGPGTPQGVATPQGSAPATSGAPASPPGPVLPVGLRASGTNSKGFHEFVNEKDGTVLVKIPGGVCHVGGEESEDEKPPHPVQLSPYLMARSPVTGAQFKRFVAATSYDAGGMWKNFVTKWGDQAPVVCVSYDDALAYCAWAGLRLPTEEEWEHAARGTQGNTYPWGSQFDSTHCQNSSGSARPGAAPVGSFPEGASPCGCLDMAGNVWEWTSSWYEAYPGNEAPSEHFGQTHRVVRGGSWYNENPLDFRAAFRFRNLPSSRGRLYGFRCARNAPAD